MRLLQADIQETEASISSAAQELQLLQAQVCCTTLSRFLEVPNSSQNIFIMLAKDAPHQTGMTADQQALVLGLAYVHSVSCISSVNTYVATVTFVCVTILPTMSVAVTTIR